MKTFFQNVVCALHRARAPILWIALAHLGGVAEGAWMVHAGNGFALGFRDRLVSRAVASDPSMLALQHGFPLRAAIADFGANLALGAAPSTVMGLGVVLPFPMAAYRGWIGGIVSVDGEHHSRLADAHERFYYLSVLLLQLLPYSLAGGAGVRLGLGFLLPRSRWGYTSTKLWLGISVEGMRDVARIYALVAPLFLVASLVEFLAR